MPLLQQILTKQEEYDDEDDWNPCKAAGVCLMLLAQCCEDDIVPHVLPFVKVSLSDKFKCFYERKTTSRRQVILLLMSGQK